MRPGRARRFGLACNDPDDDLFDSTLTTPPQHGLMPVFLQADAHYNGAWGVDRWIDAEYVPADDSTARDPFTVTSVGVDGSTSVDGLAMLPVPASQNYGGACGWHYPAITADTPGVVTVNCDDDEGDPLTADVETAPQHGTVTAAVVTPARYGSSDITVPYVPDPGYEGADCVQIHVSDGHGHDMHLTVNFSVSPAPVPEPPPPPLPDPPAPPIVDEPPAGESPASSVPDRPTTPPAPNPTAPVPPAQLMQTAVRTLATTSVAPSAPSGRANVLTRKTLSRAALLRYGTAPAMLVACSSSCEIQSHALLVAGRRSLRASRQETVSATVAGQPTVVALALSRAQRRILRRTKHAKAKFTVTIRPDSGPGTVVHRTLQVGR